MRFYLPARPPDLPQIVPASVCFQTVCRAVVPVFVVTVASVERFLGSVAEERKHFFPRPSHFLRRALFLWASRCFSRRWKDSAAAALAPLGPTRPPRSDSKRRVAPLDAPADASRSATWPPNANGRPWGRPLSSLRLPHCRGQSAQSHCPANSPRRCATAASSTSPSRTSRATRPRFLSSTTSATRTGCPASASAAS